MELAQLGPLASSATAPGGQDLRDRVWSWPVLNRCGVDQQTVAGGWDEAGYFDRTLVNVTGLAALETLLFSPPGENACPSQVDINASGAWDALGDGIQARRAAHAVALAAEVEDALADARAAFEGGFADRLAAAGDGDPYESLEAGVNAVYDALFYLESRTKDRKLGEPLGLRPCGSDSCLGSVEATLAGESHTFVAANVAAGRVVFAGGAGAGLEDLLRARDHGDLADRVLAAFDDAEAAAAALRVPVDVAATTDPTDALAAHAALDALCDLLRDEVSVALVLQVPTEAAGDND